MTTGAYSGQSGGAALMRGLLAGEDVKNAREDRKRQQAREDASFDWEKARQKYLVSRRSQDLESGRLANDAQREELQEWRDTAGYRDTMRGLETSRAASGARQAAIDANVAAQTAGDRVKQSGLVVQEQQNRARVAQSEADEYTSPEAVEQRGDLRAMNLEQARAQLDQSLLQLADASEARDRRQMMQALPQLVRTVEITKDPEILREALAATNPALEEFAEEIAWVPPQADGEAGEWVVRLSTDNDGDGQADTIRGSMAEMMQEIMLPVAAQSVGSGREMTALQANLETLTKEYGVEPSQAIALLTNSEGMSEPELRLEAIKLLAQSPLFTRKPVAEQEAEINRMVRMIQTGAAEEDGGGSRQPAPSPAPAEAMTEIDELFQ